MLEYKDEFDKVFQSLGDSKLMVLATSSQNHTTARIMSCVFYNGKIAFQTSTKFQKYQQLSENPQVALCADNISIEGIAKAVGHPLADHNKGFAELYKQYYLNAYEKYSGMKTDTVIEVTPSLITIWGYEKGEPYRIFINAQQETAYLEMYDYSI